MIRYLSLMLLLSVSLFGSGPAMAAEARPATKFFLVLPTELKEIPKGAFIRLSARVGKTGEAASEEITTLIKFGGKPAVVLDIPEGQKLSYLCFFISKKLKVHMDYGADGSAKAGCIEEERFKSGGPVLGYDNNIYFFEGYAKMM